MSCSMGCRHPQTQIRLQSHLPQNESRSVLDITNQAALLQSHFPLNKRMDKPEVNLSKQSVKEHNSSLLVTIDYSHINTSCNKTYTLPFYCCRGTRVIASSSMLFVCFCFVVKSLCLFLYKRSAIFCLVCFSNCFFLWRLFIFCCHCFKCCGCCCSLLFDDDTNNNNMISHIYRMFHFCLFVCSFVL